jgi:hypothetical protein
MHGHELPAQLLLLRDRLVYHSCKMTTACNLNPKLEESALTSIGCDNEDNDNKILSAADGFDTPSVGIEELTLDMLMVSMNFVLGNVPDFLDTRMNIYQHIPQPLLHFPASFL